MPPPSTRAALAAVTPVSASTMAPLSASFGMLRIAGHRAATAPSSSSSPPSRSSLSYSTAAAPSSLCGPQQPSSLPALTALPRTRAAPSTITRRSPTAAFSTTSPLESKARKQMRLWIKERGIPVYSTAEADTDKIRALRRVAKTRPFPSNKTFKNAPVLADDMRESIWKRVRVEGQSVKTVAAAAGVDMRRVAAVVRLKEIEKKWAAENRPLANRYSDAVLGMVRTHGTYAEKAGEPFENINEIHEHAYTKQQLFVPTPESQQFTREDAARAFHRRMLSPDKRMPIPELIQVEKDLMNGATYTDSIENFHNKATAEQEALAKADLAAAAEEEARTNRVDTDRFEFRIRDFNAENVGPTGRAREAVGWRYGVPFNDRKRGQVKIPTSVG